MAGGLIILTGPPGAGKTTLARVLAERSSAPAVHLVCDQFFEAIRSGFIAPWLPESQTQNRTVNEAIAVAAVRYAQGGYQVFVDGVVGPWFLDIFREAAREAGVPLDYVVLRPPRDVVVARARDRAENPFPDYPPNVFEGFVELGPLERHVVDASAPTVDGLAATVLAALASGRLQMA